MKENVTHVAKFKFPANVRIVPSESEEGQVSRPRVRSDLLS